MLSNGQKFTKMVLPATMRGQTKAELQAHFNKVQITDNRVVALKPTSDASKAFDLVALAEVPETATFKHTVTARRKGRRFAPMEAVSVPLFIRNI